MSHTSPAPHYCVWTSASGAKSLQRFNNEADAIAASKNAALIPDFLTKPVNTSVRHWHSVEKLGHY